MANRDRSVQQAVIMVCAGNADFRVFERICRPLTNGLPAGFNDSVHLTSGSNEPWGLLETEHSTEYRPPNDPKVTGLSPIFLCPLSFMSQPDLFRTINQCTRVKGRKKKAGAQQTNVDWCSFSP